MPAANVFQITALYATPLALLFLVLSARVIIARRRRGISFSFADDPDLERRVRVHGNFAEYVPFALLLLALAEARGAPGHWLHVAGGLLLLGRLAHALVVSRSSADDLGRILGMTGSHSAILIAALLLWVP